MSSDEQYMRIALQLAARGLGNVEPNPAVGAVIVRKGKVIGRGWHKKFGGPHAEINALEDCRKQGGNPKGATMYVTLEPCCHYGKTGPCTDALIAAKLRRVVVATIDPSRHANGKGIRRLRKAGIKVDIGECEAEARILNAPFLKFASTGRPWVTLKWAQSADGFLVRTDKKRWISGPKSRQDAHKLRRRVGAILVGIKTVIYDDPLLTPRPAHGKKPVRIVLDNWLRIPSACTLLKTAKDAPVLILTREKALRQYPERVERITNKGAQVIGFPRGGKSNLQFLLKYLGTIGIVHLLVEGGPAVIGSFIKENFADEVVVYISPDILGEKGAIDIPGLNKLRLPRVEMKRLGDDVRLNGFTNNGLKHTGVSKV